MLKSVKVHLEPWRRKIVRSNPSYLSRPARSSPIVSAHKQIQYILIDVKPF